MRIMLLFVLACVSLMLNANAASFDCAKASTKVEKIICGDVELSRLDEDMLTAYNIARDHAIDPSILKKEQLVWLKNNSNNCNSDCLENRYQIRIVELAKLTNIDSSANITHSSNHRWKYIASGDNHTCIASDSEVKCWGENKYGIFNFPREFKGITQIQSASSAHVCVKDDAGWTCWGYCPNKLCDISFEFKKVDKLVSNYNRICGIIDNNLRCLSANKVDDWPEISKLKGVKDVALGDENGCAVLNDGNVKCWGRNLNDQVMAGNILNHADSIYVGGRHTCIIGSNGKLLCSKISEKLGVFPNFGQSIVPQNENFISVALGRLHTCAISENTNIKCWGSNEYFESKPPLLNIDEKAFAISSGENHSCALTNKRVLCWGVYWLENSLQPISAEGLVKKVLQ